MPAIPPAVAAGRRLGRVFAAAAEAWPPSRSPGVATAAALSSSPRVIPCSPLSPSDLLACGCLAYSVYAVVQFIGGRTIQGWTSVMVMLTFLGAVQLVSVGVLGEYIGRIFEQTRGVPRYVTVEGDEPSMGGDTQVDQRVLDGK